MAAAKVTPQQKRERRSKMMLAGLGVVLLGVVALQLPKILKSGGGTPAAAPIVSASTTPTDALASAPASAQLTKFSRFAPKDPFKAKVVAPNVGQGNATTTPATPKPPAKPKTPPLTISVNQQPLPALPTVPAALLLVNGKKHVVALDAGYPKARPFFKVVALSDKSIWVQLIGGTFANGQQTLKLDRGRKVTLLDTTAGVRIVLTMVKPTTAPKPAATTTPTTTTKG